LLPVNLLSNEVSIGFAGSFADWPVSSSPRNAAGTWNRPTPWRQLSQIWLLRTMFPSATLPPTTVPVGCDGAPNCCT